MNFRYGNQDVVVSSVPCISLPMGENSTEKIAIVIKVYGFFLPFALHLLNFENITFFIANSCENAIFQIDPERGK